MTIRRRRPAWTSTAAARWTAAVVVLAGLAGCSDDPARDAVAGRPVASEAGPAPPAASSRPAPPRRPPVMLAGAGAGEVRVEPGPFTDRLAFGELQLVTGPEPVVRGTVEVTSDPSDLLALELQVDFYGIDGQLLGSGRQLVTDVEAEAGGVGPLPVAVPATGPLAAPATAALLSVPQLANE